MKPVQEREMYSMKDYYKNMEDSWVEFVSKNIRAQAYSGEEKATSEVFMQSISAMSAATWSESSAERATVQTCF